MNLTVQKILKNIKAEDAQDENEILEELSKGDGYTNEIILKVNL